MASGLDVSATPGWYEDPEAPDLLRWWDGENWSESELLSKPADEMNRNRIAVRARRVFFWALGVVVVFWLIPVVLTFVPSDEIQTAAVILNWVGFLPAIALSILAIVFGGIGLSRAQKLDGYRRGSALTGLIGGIGLLVVPPLFGLVGLALVIALAR
jgi:uncharacterized Tic20 family protein